MSQRSVFCIASSRGRADHIINNLKEVKFSNAEISVLFADRGAASAEVDASHEPTAKTSSTESAQAIRGVVAWVAGVRSITMPAGSDPLIVAGPIALKLGNPGTRSVADGLTDFGVPQAEAKRFETGINSGQTLIAAHTTNPEQCDRAREIFKAANAADIFTIVEVTTPRVSLLGRHRIARVNAA